MSAQNEYCLSDDARGLLRRLLNLHLSTLRGEKRTRTFGKPILLETAEDEDALACQLIEYLLDPKAEGGDTHAILIAGGLRMRRRG